MKCAIQMKMRLPSDRKSGSAGMPRPISYAGFCLKKGCVLRPTRAEVQHKVCDTRLQRHGQPRRWLFFNDTATTEIYTLPLHDALPIYLPNGAVVGLAIARLAGQHIAALPGEARRSGERVRRNAETDLVWRLPGGK